MNNQTLDLFTAPVTNALNLLHTLELFDDMRNDAQAEIEYLDAAIRKLLTDASWPNPSGLQVLRNMHARRYALTQELRRLDGYKGTVRVSNAVTIVTTGGSA